MLKILGALCLMGATSYLCLLHSRQEQARVRRCEGLLLLVRHLGVRISSFCEPIERALASFENKALDEMGFLPLVRERGLVHAILAFRTSPVLTSEEWGMLATFATELGGRYTRDALALCAATERELAAALARLREQAPARRRVGHSLLIFGGLSLFLLFG